VFDEVFVNTEYWEHIAITFDAAAGFAYCYQNGVLVQKIAYGGELSGIDWSDNEFVHLLGGDWQSERREYFKRKLSYVALYTDVRSAEEIYSDAKNGISTDDSVRFSQAISLGLSLSFTGSHHDGITIIRIRFSPICSTLRQTISHAVESMSRITMFCDQKCGSYSTEGG
jgi:hypothetical protein